MNPVREYKNASPDDDEMDRFVAVVEAAIARLRVDYDINLVYSKVTSATQEQRCKRCGFYIQIGQAIMLVEKADKSRKDWIHQNCPDVND
jgi:hypothetical protein